LILVKNFFLNDQVEKNFIKLAQIKNENKMRRKIGIKF
jgi:hypothetical protein